MSARIFTLLVSVYSCFFYAQLPISSTANRLWIGYIADVKINDSWSIWNDAHWVPDGFAIARTGLSYKFKNTNIKTTLGYGFLLQYPTAEGKPFRPEHRPWGQTTLTHKNDKWSYLHRLRYEARYREIILGDQLQNEFNFNYRLRYLFQSRYFLPTTRTKEQKWFLMFSDEILVNVGAEIKNKFRLDQNRVSAGAGIQLKKMTFQLAYMNQLIESPNVLDFRMNHNLQLLVFHNF
jgi:hypothetical protein